jgi:hypothetical protein
MPMGIGLSEKGTGLCFESLHGVGAASVGRGFWQQLIPGR